MSKINSISTLSILSGLRLPEHQPHRTVRTTAARNKALRKIDLVQDSKNSGPEIQRPQVRILR